MGVWIFTTVCFILLAGNLAWKYKIFKDELFEKDITIRSLERVRDTQIIYLEENKAFILSLMDQNTSLKKENMLLRTKSTKIPDGTIEAVRYAMIKSHPDNGGKSCDFIRFKKCYEELSVKEEI